MRVINLLPKSKQQELHYEALYHAIAIASGLIVAILLAVLVLQLGIRVYLNRHVKNTQEQIEQIKRVTNKEENNQLKQEIRLINVQMNDFKNLAAVAPPWSQVILAFSPHVPEGVKIRELTADATTKKVVITGFSPTREQVIELYNNVSGDRENFRDIDYPLENVAAPIDVRFHYTFYIQDNLLKPTSP